MYTFEEIRTGTWCVSDNNNYNKQMWILLQLMIITLCQPATVCCLVELHWSYNGGTL